MGSYCATLTQPGWKMADRYRKFSSSSSCDDWKMTRYISGTSIIRFSSFLAWTGLVSSLLFILGSLDMILTPLAVGVHSYYSRGCSHYYNTSICGTFYGVGTVTLVMNIGMFIYSFKLWKAIRSDKMKDMGSLELVTTVAAGVMTPMFIIAIEYLNSYYGPSEKVQARPGQHLHHLQDCPLYHLCHSDARSGGHGSRIHRSARLAGWHQSVTLLRLLLLLLHRLHGGPVQHHARQTHRGGQPGSQSQSAPVLKQRLLSGR